MTKREEFLPEEHPLLLRYNQLLVAIERVVRYRCGECVHPTEKHCSGCVYHPLRAAIDRAKDDKNRMGIGMG